MSVILSPRKRPQCRRGIAHRHHPPQTHHGPGAARIIGAAADHAPAHGQAMGEAVAGPVQSRLLPTPACADLTTQPRSRHPAKQQVEHPDSKVRKHSCPRSMAKSRHRSAGPFLANQSVDPA